MTSSRTGSGVLTTCHYDEGGRLTAVDRAGTRYSVASDQVGSPRVFTAPDGTDVKVVEYDSFGTVTADSAPDLDFVVGFAGGLTDDDTALVRFGLRDCEPATGRWTARDPALYAGRQTNLFAYVGNDPVRLADRSGLFSIELAAYAGVGGGLKFSFTREGFSWCGQVGFGGGINLTVDAEGGLDHEALGVFAEAKASVLGIATVKGKIEALNPCGVGPGNGDVDVKFKSEACIGPACTDADHAYMKLDPTQPEKFIPSLKPEIGISGKAGVKACAQVLW